MKNLLRLSAIVLTATAFVNLTKADNFPPTVVGNYIKMASKGTLCGVAKFKPKKGKIKLKASVVAQSGAETMLGEKILDFNQEYKANYDWAGPLPTSYYRVYVMKPKGGDWEVVDNPSDWVDFESVTDLFGSVNRGCGVGLTGTYEDLKMNTKYH